MLAGNDQEAVITTWRRFREDPAHDEPGISRAVPIIDLLDEEVDLTPARHLSAQAPERTAERFTQAQASLATVAGELRDLVPDLRPAKDPREVSAIPVAELARTGHLAIHHAPSRGESGIAMQAGDIVVAVAAGRFTVRVLDADGGLLDPGLTLLRVDQGQLDPHFVAGALRGSANAQTSIAQTGGIGRADIRRAQVPQLPLADQRRYGEAFRRVADLESAARSAATMGAELARLLADGIAEGTLQPPNEQTLRP
jgi:hypothetical protein